MDFKQLEADLEPAINIFHHVTTIGNKSASTFITIEKRKKNLTNSRMLGDNHHGPPSFLQLFTS